MKPDNIDRALAFCEVHECVEQGDATRAAALSRDYALPLSRVWAPEDDGWRDRTGDPCPSGGLRGDTSGPIEDDALAPKRMPLGGVRSRGTDCADGSTSSG